MTFRKRDTIPDEYRDKDTEVDVLDSAVDDELSGVIDPTDEHDVAAIHDVHPIADTADDRHSSWPAATTLPFARQESSKLPVRLDNGKSKREPERPTVGQRYLNYEIRRRLARGSMGLVYEAKHLHLGRRVAIKFLSPSLLSDENMVYRFLGEAQAMARIEHPGIPTVFDFGQDRAGNAYLIMDYLEGESLAAKLTRDKLPLDTILEVAAQTAEILAAAHKENIVHRDLKPENILLCDEDEVTPQGPRPVVRLIDFGICKARSADERVETAAGNLIGTPRYMAPEQTYSKAVTPRTDVYALGCVIFELVCNRPPFDGKLAELVDAHRHRVPDDIRQHCPTAPTKLAELVALMLAKEAGARPKSGSDLARALRECKRDLDQPSPPPRQRRQPRSERAQRAPLPTPRASTARVAFEEGMLNAERTPLPFHAKLEPTPPPQPSISMVTTTPMQAMEAPGGTTEVTIGSGRISWIALGLALIALAGLGISLASGLLH